MTRLLPSEDSFADALLSIKGSVAQRVLHDGLLRSLPDSLETYSVLEAGCGGGSFTRKVLKRSPESVVAGDINLSSLERVASFSAANLTTLQVDLSQPLVFEDGQFNCIICSSVLMHLSPIESQQCITEFSRVLSPGGLLIIAVLHEAYATHSYDRELEYGEYAYSIPLGESNKRIIEYYPPADHYRKAIQSVGLSCEESVLYSESVDQAGQEFEGSIPLWRVFKAQ